MGVAVLKINALVSIKFFKLWFGSFLVQLGRKDVKPKFASNLLCIIFIFYINSLLLLTFVNI